MPFFSFGELIHAFIYSRFKNIYEQYRFSRGDNTLLMYLLKGFAAKVNNYYIGIYNRFSYKRMDIEVENGSQDGEKKAEKYYLMPKKIYSERFATNTHGRFFIDKAMCSKLGIEDLPCFSSVQATSEELEKENSYFFKNMSEWN